MEPSPFPIFSIQLLLLLLLLLTTTSNSQQHTNFTDLSSLLAFKAGISDHPHGTLTTTWTPNTSFCTWTGITCSRRRQRVTAINLQSLSLQGTISPLLANLSFLSHLVLANNSLTGPIPPTLARLPRLALLVLEHNHLSGPIPYPLLNLSSLTTVSLAFNNLSHSLPTAFNCTKLRWISLSMNQLIGSVPSSFAWCRNLRALSLSNNNFSGTIPPDFGANWPHLTEFNLGGNQLTGTIPISLGNLTSLEQLFLSHNSLEGPIPSSLGNLKNLQGLQLGFNTGLNGSIPITLLNASNLSYLDLANNQLTGPVPATIGDSWPLLTLLDIGINQLTGGFDFIASLPNCRHLQSLTMDDNKLEGFLPNSAIGNLSLDLQYFFTWSNRIKGEIPEGFANLTGLLLLDLGGNEITGAIPSAFTRLDGLQALELTGNRIQGPIPPEIGLMTSLNSVYLDDNALSGPIPDSLGNISGMQWLSLGTNALSSSIPLSLWSLANLLELTLSRNALVGSLPVEVRNMKALAEFDASKNRLSGNLPSDLGALQMLTYLDLSNNSFQGPIPQSLGGLISVEYLNLSFNSLTGTIPQSLADLRYVSTLDLSSNKLYGKIPEGRVFSNLSNPSLKGNAQLCGAPKLNFQPCATNYNGTSIHSRSKAHVLKYVLPAIAAAVILLACFCLLLKLRRRKAKIPDQNHSSHDVSNYHRLISYHELVRATDNFSEANLLGRGGTGSVFKGCLDDGLVAAVKVLNLEVEGASRSFDLECQALSAVRHRNLVKIITTCSNLDFKALVLEFMANGSLEKWLYEDDYHLSLIQRMNIMVDVSSALEHLHHHHPHVVIHCDLKPSNVLLDENLVAHVGDFGIAKLLLGDSTSVMSTNAPGTVGYMAPEYGSSGKVSRKGDVYSFGILLLETFTRKKPISAMFDGESSLRQWVSKSHPFGVLKIVDSNLFTEDSMKEEDGSKGKNTLHECLVSIIELGLLCSRDSPKERLLMKDVVPKLQRIRREYLSTLPAQ